MTSLYPDTSDIFNNEEPNQKPKKGSKGVAKFLEEDKEFKYFSYSQYIHH